MSLKRSRKGGPLAVVPPAEEPLVGQLDCASVQGSRLYQEDRYAVCCGGDRLAVAVFDGHGGSVVSEWWPATASLTSSQTRRWCALCAAGGRRLIWWRTR